MAVAGYAAARGWPGYATRLSAIMRRYLETGGHYDDAVTIYTHARRAACEAGEQTAEAHALNNHGLIDGGWAATRRPPGTSAMPSRFSARQAIGPVPPVH